MHIAVIRRLSRMSMAWFLLCASLLLLIAYKEFCQVTSLLTLV
uniref:Uncharacterized protein n=1 Tax=Arundo donax TaxID=35708 RepID=A0A0A9H344_ARUDO